MPTYAARCTQCKREFEFFVAKIENETIRPTIAESKPSAS
jgi:predicted nucleic acid-binding Zn ribbon protein